MDDILLVCNPGDVEWFQTTVGETVTMKVDGPHLPGSGSQLLVSQEKDDNETKWDLAATQFKLHPKVGGADEGKWKKKEGPPIPCDA